ncbi:GTP-binding protein GEM-like [Uloborus diversus]|uniref:GTP-binding protein GEM-like n=1 Tax=Uloborus diversus TaxID=327109 RepID=UPI0024094F4E|nr:GTP-binding protein GEM-like [Uloborus diversus]
MEQDEPLNPDSPKRHSDPAPCTAAGCRSPPPSPAFAFSVPDLREYRRRNCSSSPATRRTSHPATPTRRPPRARRFSYGGPRSLNASPRMGAPQLSPVPFRRGSLHEESKIVVEEVSGDYQRLRSFSVTSRGVVNLGDLLRARSPSITSDDSNSSGVDAIDSCFRDRLPSTDSCPPPARVSALLLGSSGVGKSSLIAQFATSECLTANGEDTPRDGSSREKLISLLVDGEETEVVCEDSADSKGEVDKYTFMRHDAFLLIYSVTDRSSLHAALRMLNRLRGLQDRIRRQGASLSTKVFILVANKVDLVRGRIVSVEEGRSLADKMEVKYIETSVGFHHNVDELLVGVVTQVRLKREQQTKEEEVTNLPNFLTRSTLRLTCKARGFMDRLLQKCDLKARSCDNLNVL